jgi:serine/threonine protein kinase
MPEPKRLPAAGKGIAMALSTQVSERLLRWQQLRQQGQAITAEELCRDCPELREELEKQIRALEVMLSIAGTGPGLHEAGTMTPPAVLPELAQEANQEFQALLSPSQAADEIGRLASYRVLQVLGQGGMGIVFKAEDVHLGRLVAMKVMRPSLAANASARQRFLREARAIAALEHDHIVTVYQVGEERGVPFLAMPLLKGESLEDRLKREGQLSVWDVLRIGREIALGLCAAHALGLIHRDIKPSNIWLETRDGGQAGSPSPSRVKILDFGLVRAMGDKAGLTQPGVFLGTPQYMAPEQANGSATDGRSDLYSLGCVLYRMASGELPFRGDDLITTLVTMLTDPPKPLHQVNPQVPLELSELVLKLLAKTAGDRPATARVVADTLHAIAVKLKAGKRPVPPGPRPTARTPAGATARSSGAPRMPYTAEISRTNPTCFLFLIDQSGSMDNRFGGDAGKKKSESVADAINRLLQTLVLRCAKAEGVRDYYHVGVIGYGNHVAPALGGSLVGRDLVPVSELANNPLRVDQRIKKVDDGLGGLIEQKVKFPVWFEPVAGGQTPMCQAFDLAQQILRDFIGRCPGCFPPIVMNISDGQATDGNPEADAKAIRDLVTDDGQVLLFNLQISSHNEKPVQFPDSEANLPDEQARLLFRMSSPLPPQMQEAARREGFAVSANTRGFVFQADLVSVIQFLEIGTRVDKNVKEFGLGGR